MKVQSPAYFWLGVLLTLPVAYFVVDRVHFTWTSRTAMSTVQEVSASNGRCGGRKSRHNCTEYSAQLNYVVNNVTYRISVGAGSARGHDQPLGHANHHVGQVVAVAYNPRNPGNAYRDTFWDIWGMPIITFMLQIGAFFGSLSEPKRKD